MFCGKRICFHGAFSKKRKAMKKEREVKGSWIEEHLIRGRERFIVMTDKFFSR